MSSSVTVFLIFAEPALSVLDAVKATAILADPLFNLRSLWKAAALPSTTKESSQSQELCLRQ